MSVRGLLQWQWSDYSAKHRSRPNLLIHIVAVPLFQIGCLGAACGVFRLSWRAAALGIACVIVSFVLQGRGHRLEAEAPAPFAGPGDVVRRLMAEQWITFPRFVFSGGWYRNLQGGRHG